MTNGADDVTEASDGNPPLGIASTEGLDARSRSAWTVDGPTCVSFSGGRTSAYMLRKLLMAHGGTLPDDCHVVFANTGKEDEATLRFVRDCAELWQVPITWVEYTAEAPGWRVVDFASASRQGEPFEALLQIRPMLPNPTVRFCTQELKIRVIAKYLMSVGFEGTRTELENTAWLGIRADEPARAAKIPDKRRIPLWATGVTAAEVGAFWSRNDWDLGLPNMNGKTMHGNCDLCFLKPAAQIASLVAEKPERAVWWARMEANAERTASTARAARFRQDRPSYAQILAFTQAQADAFGHLAAEADDGIECIGCTD